MTETPSPSSHFSSTPDTATLAHFPLPEKWCHQGRGALAQ